MIAPSYLFRKPGQIPWCTPRHITPLGEAQGLPQRQHFRVYSHKPCAHRGDEGGGKVGPHGTHHELVCVVVGLTCPQHQRATDKGKSDQPSHDYVEPQLRPSQQADHEKHGAATTCAPDELRLIVAHVASLRVTRIALRKPRLPPGHDEQGLDNEFDTQSEISLYTYCLCVGVATKS